MILQLLAAFAASSVLTLWLVHVFRRAPRPGLDDNFAQPQKVHRSPTPRIGGIGIAVGLVFAALLQLGSKTSDAQSMALLMACAMPAFITGLMHDFTDRFTPRGRLLATMVSAALAYFVVGTRVVSSDVPGLDLILATGLGSLLVTVLAVSGIANAVNIIDGLNGLASMCVIIMLAGVGYVAAEVGDRLVLSMALAGVGAVLGFFIWNYPSGLIFLGDGGAYFLGFYVAEVCILLLVRNPEVSGLFALLICIYPIFETLFSAWRRYWLRAQPASLPDGIHLHSLVYRRLVRWAVGEEDSRATVRGNSLSSPYLWVLCSASVAPATLFWDDPSILAAMILLFALSYLALYRRIVKFQAQRWLSPPGSKADRHEGAGREGDNPPT